MNHFPTSAAREALALRFKLPYSDAMQDWEWEVADFKRFGEFLNAYKLLELSESERYSLMEVLIQCAEDTASEEELAAALCCIRPLLSNNFELHRKTHDLLVVRRSAVFGRGVPSVRLHAGAFEFP